MTEHNFRRIWITIEKLVVREIGHYQWFTMLSVPEQ